ncbi:MAG: division/cell wall cluster transcriptional repressor MraZ [Patescibacteria group bacterium]|nr:division/cell wall cluster transcriptional repressor MraZ [Patescibacteria group bacterium]
MLIGEYKFLIDEKKRLAIPSKFRKSLGKKVVIARGIDNCLVIYHLNEWTKEAKKLEGLNKNQSAPRSLARIMFSGACDVDIDKLGRVLIPDYLMKYAFLKKNAAILGLSDRIEVWDDEKWEENKKKTEMSVSDIAENINSSGTQEN